MGSKILQKIVNTQLIGNSLLHLNGTKAMTGDLDMNNNEIKNPKDPVGDKDDATKKLTNTQLNTKVNKSVDSINGTLNIFGELDMNNNKIIGVANPTSTRHAANEAYVDNAVSSKADLTYTNTQIAQKLNLSGGNIAGNINLVNTHKIINSPDPTSDKDLVTKKYIESDVSQSHVTSSNQSNAFKYVTDLRR